MNLKTNFCRFMVLAVFLICGLCPADAQENKKFRVLVVFSYENSHPFTGDYKEGIESVLGTVCEIRYFFMNTKMNFNGGPEKAKEAFAVYEEFQPDGVIVADDDAQAMFVVPYLKDRVKTPVIFCGVNAEPEKYGYPASNITGILERLHIRESISLVQQLIPSAKHIGFLMKESPLAVFVTAQTEKEADTYSAVSAGVSYPKTLKEALAMAEEFKKTCDMLYASGLEGLLGEDGNPLTEKEMYKTVVKAFGKPVIGSNAYQVRLGALCSVVQRMQEQGEVAARMLLKAMQGTPISEIPITRNLEGKRVLNVSVLKKLGIKPQAEVLTKTEFVTAEE
ncbi:MAG: ABC transporter substrate binding protein [Desulfobacterales bacterium]